jgi:hypothetical protein
MVAPGEGIRECWYCKKQGSLVHRRYPSMMKHIKQKHGWQLGFDSYLPTISANLRELKRLNPTFRYSCSSNSCSDNMETFFEQFLHSKTKHAKWSTSEMHICLICFKPLLGMTMEEHYNEVGSSHNICCETKAIFPHINFWLNHILNSHFYATFRSLDVNFRTTILSAIYNRTEWSRWATMCPLVVDFRTVLMNDMLPDIFSTFYLNNSAFNNPLNMVDFLFDKTINMKSTLSKLDSGVHLTTADLTKIKFELMAGHFYRGLSIFMLNQKLRKKSDWYMENMAFWDANSIPSLDHAFCIKCQDQASHISTPHCCFNRIAEKEFGNLFRLRKPKELIDPNKNLFFAASETLNISAGPSWHSLGTGDPEISYNTIWGIDRLWRPILEEPYTGNMQWGPGVNTYSVTKDYFSIVSNTLATILPQSTTWIALEYFSKLLPNNKSGYPIPNDVEVLKEAYAYLFFLQQLRNRYPRILVVLPLTSYHKDMPITEYMLRQRYAFRAGLIMQKLCAKLNIIVVPTQGWIEAHPIVGEQGINYFSACLSPPSQLIATRNSDGASLNREGRRRFQELMELFCKSTNYAENTIKIWQQKQIKQLEGDIDPTLLQGF